MNRCEVASWLAYGMAVYCIASLYYYLRTKAMGTPFKDSLTKKQLEIKNKSVAERKKIFIQGVVGGFVGLMFFQPFKKCF